MRTSARAAAPRFSGEDGWPATNPETVEVLVYKAHHRSSMWLPTSIDSNCAGSDGCGELHDSWWIMLWEMTEGYPAIIEDRRRPQQAELLTAYN